MIRIACMGDNVVDINYIDRMIHPGGNCVNAAVYCSQLGHEAAYVGVLADDSYARIVTDSLKANGVDYSKCVVKHGETGRCTCDLIEGDRVLGDENDGGLVKSQPLVIDESLLDYLKTFDLIHTSCYSYIDDQLPKVKAAGIPLLYDFSTVWDKEKVKEIGKSADYILFSRREELTEEENRQMLCDAVDCFGCRLAVLTMGVNGACVYDGKNVYEKEPYNVTGGAVDTTGCGDSWISGFITTYAEAEKRLRQMKETAGENFILPENEEDARKHIIELSMCMGNLKARHTCRIKGAYGCGISIDSFREKELIKGN